MKDTGLKITPPHWLDGFLDEREAIYPDTRERMRLVVALAMKNVEMGTGGPFGAAVFDMDTHALISAAVNQVESSNCSVLHAEIVALALAQKKLGSYDLGGPGMPRCELVTSVEPCAMCFGALPWSGIRRLVCGATAKDAEAIGFDEGDKVADWAGSLTRRGIEVVEDVLKAEAAGPLKRYMSSGGKIYNSRSGAKSR